MNMTSQTRPENWDGFWAKNAGSRFTRKSWSKTRMIHVLKPFLRPGLKVAEVGASDRTEKSSEGAQGKAQQKAAP